MARANGDFMSLIEFVDAMALICESQKSSEAVFKKLKTKNKKNPPY